MKGKNLFFLILLFAVWACSVNAQSEDYEEGRRCFLKGDKNKAAEYFLKVEKDKSFRNPRGDYDLANFFQGDARFARLAPLEFTKFLQNFFQEYDKEKFRSLSPAEQSQLRDKVIDALLKRRRINKAKFDPEGHKLELKVHKEGWKKNDISAFIAHCKKHYAETGSPFLKDSAQIAIAKLYAADGDFEQSEKYFQEYFQNLKSLIDLLYPDKEDFQALAGEYEARMKKVIQPKGVAHEDRIFNEYMKNIITAAIYKLWDGKKDEARQLLAEVSPAESRWGEISAHILSLIEGKEPLKINEASLPLHFGGYESARHPLEWYLSAAFADEFSKEQKEICLKICLLSLYSF